MDFPRSLYHAPVVLLILALGLCCDAGTARAADDGEEREAHDAQGCGVERWSVKCLDDTGAGRVNFTPVDRTVAQLRALDTVTPGFADPRRSDETTTYRTVCVFKGFKLESDRDIHVVIGDTLHHSYEMIAEIPDSTCDDAIRGGHARDFGAARRALLAIAAGRGFTLDTVFHWFSTPYPLIRVTGVGYYDPPHGQTGMAPDHIELHPVLSVRAYPDTANTAVAETPGNPGTLDVFPVPFATRLYVRAGAGERSVVELVDALGRVVARAEPGAPLDASSLPDGAYRVVLRAGAVRAQRLVLHLR